MDNNYTLPPTIQRQMEPIHQALIDGELKRISPGRPTPETMSVGETHPFSGGEYRLESKMADRWIWSRA